MDLVSICFFLLEVSGFLLVGAHLEFLYLLLETLLFPFHPVQPLLAVLQLALQLLVCSVYLYGLGNLRLPPFASTAGTPSATLTAHFLLFHY